MKFLSVILLLCVLFGCNTQKEVEQEEVELSEQEEVELSEQEEVELSEQEEVELSEQEEVELSEQEEVEFTEISLPTLINDVVDGGLFYEEKHIKIRAIVKEMGSISMMLETHRQAIFFYVLPKVLPKDAEELSKMSEESAKKYKVGESYTFKLYVRDINYTVNYRTRLTSANWHIHTLLFE